MFILRELDNLSLTYDKLLCLSHLWVKNLSCSFLKKFIGIFVLFPKYSVSSSYYYYNNYHTPSLDV